MYLCIPYVFMYMYVVCMYASLYVCMYVCKDLSGLCPDYRVVIRWVEGIFFRCKHIFIIFFNEVTPVIVRINIVLFFVTIRIYNLIYKHLCKFV